MRSWSQAFNAYLLENDDGTKRDTAITQMQVSFDHRVPISTVHNWRNGGRPRDEQLRARIEEWSGGRVSRHLPREPIPADVVKAEESGPSLPDADDAPTSKAG